MSLARVTDQSAVFAKLGSFWSRNMAPGETSKARVLSRHIGVSSARAALESAVSNLGATPCVLDEHLVLQLKPGNILRLGVNLDQRVSCLASDGTQIFSVLRRPSSYDTDVTGASVWDLSFSTNEGSSALLTEDCEFLLLPVDPAHVNTVPGDLAPEAWVSYLIPIPFGIYPLLIDAATRRMVAGIDFYVGEGFIRVWENPSTLFPSQRISIRSYRRQLVSWFNYTLQVDQSRNTGGAIAEYYRGKQSVAQFEQAIAEAASLVVLRESARLLSVCRGVGDRRAYIFDNGLVEVAYKHAELIPQTTYPGGKIIGDAVKVTPGTGYRTLDWEAGLSLTGLCPFPSLLIPDRNCRFDAVEVDAASGKYHVRIWLDGPRAILEKFWTFTKEQELRTGKFLNDVVGLPTLGASKFMNPLDFYFKYLLSEQAWIITLRASDIGGAAASKALDFINREKPIGCVPIIRSI